MGFRIVNASPRHLTELEALEKRCFSLPWTEEMLMGQLPDDNHEFLAAESESGELLGYVGMMTVLDEGYISNVAVAPEQRRQGIADALITELLERAALRALSFVTLEVREHNEPAIALYAKHGFVPVGLRKNYYEAPVENAILMTKFLK
jgi:ribosomal-protein-alanine N-acetyltransferase